jgi:hypothetical protein
MSKYSQDKIEVSLIWHGETDKAIKVSEGVKDAEGNISYTWLPKSQITYERRKDSVEIEMPEWLYEKSGLSS